MPSFWRRLGQRPAPPPLPEIIEHFNQRAADEEHFPSTIDPRIYHVQLLLEYFGDLNGKRVLDVGCGTGRVTEALLALVRGGRVLAMDASAEMVTLARRRPQPRSVACNPGRVPDGGARVRRASKRQ